MKWEWKQAKPVPSQEESVEPKEEGFEDLPKDTDPNWEE